ncbi:hypothetical protein J6590_086542 [Homalodisca vitripennis]|nr:hypothetical protein J6590_086542 [Homalodisca vitripennis]
MLRDAVACYAIQRRRSIMILLETNRLFLDVRSFTLLAISHCTTLLEHMNNSINFLVQPLPSAINHIVGVTQQENSKQRTFAAIYARWHVRNADEETRLAHLVHMSTPTEVIIPNINSLYN